ncbi:hypothetical protein [Streptomyces sp. AS02]|uniref:hypothetical protein n=1 Tax=Streptomyces sp. AS02 TaxID=2938946 RepID=UPI002020FE62|nr:hypothetical protein [Streptomyces sp. AS02]MCL8016899.1 hypothetical protein [Streptomyces sp. AS02]
MSHGKHRAPKPRNPRRLRRIAAGLALSAAATTGTLLTTDLPATPADTAWGSAETTSTVPGVTGDAADVITPLDTAWG